MPLDLSRFETFCSRLPIRDRDTGHTVPFLFTPPQKHIMRDVIQHRRNDMPCQILLYKSRRTGGSTWAVALLIDHCIAKPGASAYIIAHLDKTARELFNDRAVPFAKAVQSRGVEVEITKSEIVFHFPGGKTSKLKFATAKTVIGGRGLTASAVLLSEAAFYPGEGSFVSILNALSKDPDNIIIIETTPNGIEGPGEAFYNYWNAAVDGSSGFIPIFMPWWEDPGLSLPDGMADDAPANDYEEWLMREFACTKGQIAWYRWTMETKCAGSKDMMMQENPSTPEEGFISTGTPAFDSDEQSLAKKSVCAPIARGIMRRYDSEWQFDESPTGPLCIWEYPDPKGQYYIGVDAAKGVGTGDFASMSCWNGDTGRKAFRFAERIKPETAAGQLNALGRWYNNAMINIEFTGGWGYIIAKELRDQHFYPSQYLWRSRDEGINAKPRQTMGWETTERSRRMLIDLFRTALRRKHLHVMDAESVKQMSRASIELGWRWSVIKGHDDIFMSDMLGWVCVEQYHTPRLAAAGTKHPNTLEKQAADTQPERTTWVKEPFSTEFGTVMQLGNEHLKMLERYDKQAKRGDPLEGI